MNKQELIERIKGLKNFFGKKAEYIEIDAAIKLIEQLNEPQKPVIPQFVANWIKYCKRTGVELQHALNMEDLYFYNYANQKDDLKLKDFFEVEGNQDLFARAWLDGFEIEKEKRYIVKVKNIGDGWEYLKWNSVRRYWYFGNKARLDDVRLYHTLENLQKGGFGNVFINPLFTIEEVEE